LPFVFSINDYFRSYFNQLVSFKCIKTNKAKIDLIRFYGFYTIFSYYINFNVKQSKNHDIYVKIYLKIKYENIFVNIKKKLLYN